MIDMGVFKDENNEQSSFSSAHAVVSSVARNTEEICMPEDKFQFWYNAIFHDDAVFMKELLQHCNGAERQLLVNGRFVYNRDDSFVWKHETLKEPTCAFGLPLALAICFGSEKALQVLMSMGCDVTQTDTGGNNILHAVILTSALNDGEDFVPVFSKIMCRLSIDEKRMLLMMENEEKLRPLELAAQMQEFELQMAILRTRDVYSFLKGNYGMYEHIMYDITDYENVGENRSDRSPLLFLTHLKEDTMKQTKTSKTILSPVMTEWYMVKNHSNKSIIIFWALLRALYHIYVTFAASYVSKAFIYRKHVFEVYPLYMNNMNETDNCVELASSLNMTNCKFDTFLLVCTAGSGYDVVLYSLMAISSLLLFVDFTVRMIEFFYRKCAKDGEVIERMKGGPLVGNTFFGKVQTLFVFFTLASVAFLFLSLYSENALLIGIYFLAGTVSFIVSTLLNIWSYLYFVQFMPVIGHFVITIQRMLGDTFNFFMVFMLFLLTFAGTFQNVLYVNGFCTNTGFDDFSLGLYKTFAVMLNMVNLEKYVSANWTVGLVHIIYVMLVTVLLLNFLIALMSNSVMNVGEHQQVLIVLQKLQANLVLEFYFKRLFKFWYQWQQKKHLLIENDRIYIRCLERKQV